MIWPQLDKTKAAKVFEELFRDGKPETPFKSDVCQSLNVDSKNAFIELREKIKLTYDDAVISGKRGFDIDLYVSLELYVLTLEMGIPIRVASSMPFWYWVSLRLIPDLILSRFVHMDIEAIEGRYYKNYRRVWPYMLWWGVHLTWQGNREKTEWVLNNGFTVSAIEALLDRGGSGYRIDLFREISAVFADFSTKYQVTDKDLLRSVIAFNTTRAVNIEPNFYKGGVKDYVQDLFAPFIKDLKLRNK